MWFAAARSVCSWVCVNFDLIFFCGSSCGFGICYWFDLILGWIFFLWVHGGGVGGCRGGGGGGRGWGFYYGSYVGSWW